MSDLVGLGVALIGFAVGVVVGGVVLGLVGRRVTKRRNISDMIGAPPAGAKQEKK